ncbi:hypothetical protein [Streptomyces albidochromogenes]|uniref:Uncharacterized protein n=1 Tax=Streptomyces albidochromogenes TaxID=329524 RepID=A0ABW6FU67_9ACTN
MLAVALLLPPFLLGLVVLMGRYEDRMLTPSEAPRHARRRHHLRLVPAAAPGGPAPEEPAGGHAAA